VVVTAYNRPDGLARLLDDLEREGLTGPRVHVYDDRSPQPDRALERRIHRLGCVLHRAERHHGKRLWWQWWNAILGDLEEVDDPDAVVLVLQDDVRLCRDLTRRALSLFDAIDDPDKASLHLHLSAERSELGGRCWTPSRATAYGDVTRTGWVDMGAFVARARLFQALDWRLYPVPSSRWARRETLGSGVGEQISMRAHAAGLGMYQVRQSLVVHDHSPSQMNEAARHRWPLRTLNFVDGPQEAERLASVRPAVLASLASVPSREAMLREVVERLRPQVDHLMVYLNGHTLAPAFLDGDDVTVVSSSARGDRGDAGKFFPAGRHTGVHLACDDDIAYPADYVAAILDGIERHCRRAVVGFHASTLREPFIDYHVSRSITHMSRAAARDVPVHVLGTGTVGFHSSTLTVRRRDFPEPNMADVWFALLGQRQGVPFVQLRHEAGWLRELHRGQADQADGIYARARQRVPRPGDASPETAAVLSLQPWRLGRLDGPSSSSAQARSARAGRLVRVPVTGPQRSAVLALPAGDHITVAVQRSGTYYERDVLDAVQVLQVRGVYVDVGAHYGNHTAYFALECGADQVVAVEPDAEAAAGLRRTLAENGIQHLVHVHEVAVHPTWRHVSPAPLRWRGRDPEVATNTGIRRFRADRAGRIEALPLDRLLGETEGIGLIKVDAGGLSGEILGSGRRILGRHRPVVVAAAGDERERTALRMVLEPLGYQEVGCFGWSPTWLWSPGAGEP
jgi:FkbM family methyltransferase